MQMYDCAASFRVNIVSQTISWLQMRYEYGEGDKVLLEGLYRHYLAGFCEPLRLEPKRRAELGKIVRLAFPSVAKRRVGPAGGQVSYYFGIIATASDRCPEETERKRSLPVPARRRRELELVRKRTPRAPRREPMQTAVEHAATRHRACEERRCISTTDDSVWAAREDFTLGSFFSFMLGCCEQTERQTNNLTTIFL